MKTIIISTLTLATILVSCGEGPASSQDVSTKEQTPENTTKTSLSAGEASSAMENKFTIPKEINTDLFVVAFYEKVSNANSYIVYNNEKKKEATKYMYFDDDSIGKRKLIAESAGLFREIFENTPEDRPHYKITDDAVEYLYTNGKLAYTYPILR